MVSIHYGPYAQVSPLRCQVDKSATPLFFWWIRTFLPEKQWYKPFFMAVRWSPAWKDRLKRGKVSHYT